MNKEDLETLTDFLDALCGSLGVDLGAIEKALKLVVMMNLCMIIFPESPTRNMTIRVEC